MRTFYTESDIEDLAASGVRQLEVGPEVVLTDAARQLAEELGIVLVVPGAAPTGKATLPAAPARNETLPGKPRGCQHGPLSASSSHAQITANGGRVVDQLVEAVSALKKQGG
ncbi:MAG: hypothetical protein EHM40_00600 [Chloroflexi bacterium]|nr:MAG: hypothetical protein EHM40_00600 [Chloroflexota bacterium]